MTDVRLNDEEQAAMDDLLSFMKRLNDMGLNSNLDEMTAAIHVLQSFVTQHMLHRLDPEAWANWYPKNG